MKVTNAPKKLFNVPILLLITVVLLFLLFVLFPWKAAHYLNSQDTNLLKEQFSSRLKTEYHQMLNSSKNTPDDVLTFAESLRDHGLWKNAITLLNKKIDTSQINKQQQQKYALILLYSNVDAYHSSGNNDNQTSQIHKVRKQLLDLEKYKQFSTSELQTLAELSSDFSLLPLASRFYYRLAEKSMNYRSEWFSEAGRAFNQVENYSDAAKAFKLASDSSKKETIYNEFTHDWLIALIKSDQLDQVKAYLNNIEQQMPNSLKVIEALANICIQAGLPEKASHFFAYLAKNDSTDQQRWYEKASYWASKAEDYKNATNYLSNASKITSKDNDKWFITQRQIDIYVKAEMPERALELILPLVNDNPKNLKLINEGVNISLKNNNLKIASKLNKMYLEQEPNALNALNRQADIELSNKQYKQAVNYLKRVIRIKPDSLKPRERWADIEEQEGNHEIAKDLWQWIYKYSNNKKHLQKVISIAQANINGSGLEILQQIAREDELPKQAAYDVFFHLIKKNRKKLAEQFLQKYLTTHKPDKSLLKTLAKWYSGEKRYTKSLKTWNRIEKNYGVTRATSLNKFELFWLLKKKRKAYKLWVKNKSFWNKKANRRQLAIMAEVAWKYKHNRQALSYYKRLIKKKYRRSLRERTFQYMRIALLQKKLGQTKSALNTFRNGFIKTSSPELLINGLQLSFDRHDKHSFKTLTALTKKRRSRVKSRARYWILQAAQAQRNKSYKTALRYYKRALLLKPKSHEAHAGIRAIKKITKHRKRKKIAMNKAKRKYNPKEINSVINSFNKNSQLVSCNMSVDSKHKKAHHNEIDLVIKQFNRHATTKKNLPNSSSNVCHAFISIQVLSRSV